MPIQVKTGDVGGGSWRSPVANGNLRFKSGPVGGGSWVAPGYARIKVGAIGGGSWVDSGYVAYPFPPGAPYVYAWDYSTVTVAWPYAAAGGPPIDHYHVVQTNEAGTWLNEANVGGNLSPAWGISIDTRYQYYVQSVGTNGLASAWQGPVRVQIGHPATDNYGYVTHTDPWSSVANIDRLFINQQGGVNVPSGVTVTQLQINLHVNQPSSVTIYMTTASRQVLFIVAGAVFGYLPSGTGTPWVENKAWSQNTSGLAGIKLQGSGWATTQTSSNWTVSGTITAVGTYTYTNYEVISTNPAVGNSYW